MSGPKGGIDWAKCIFCQKDLKSCKTTCPGNSKRSDIGCGYKSLSDAVIGYLQFNQLPADINVQLWDEGDGIEATLARHLACWHRRCRNRLLHTTTLSRKRKLEEVAANDCSELLDDTDVNSIDESPVVTPRITRTSSGLVVAEIESLTCFFCNKPGNDLRQVMTWTVNEQVHKCASIVQDSLLLSKLARGDMIAQEAKYHPVCLLALYRTAAQRQPVQFDANIVSSKQCSEMNVESIALAELIAYMEDVRSSELTPSVFKLSDLIKLYSSHLQKQQVGFINKVNSSRLKDRLMENYPGLVSVNHGREVLLTFNEHIGEALQQLHDTSDAEAIHIMHAVKTIRNEILTSKFEFDGSFNAAVNMVPRKLLTFVNMLLEGPGNFETGDNQAALTISQLIVYNAVKRPRRKSSSDDNSVASFRHSLDREMPLPMYVGLKLHSVTRKRKIIDKFFKLGLSISYDRVMQISNKIANSICELYRSKNLVCPPVLQPNVFTVAAADNIDHNLGSNTAQSSFHGTAISLIQFPTMQNTDNAEIKRCSSLQTAASDFACDISLPSSYTDVPPCILPSAPPAVPKLDFCLTDLDYVQHLEYDWLNCVYESVCENIDHMQLAWAAYRAEKAFTKQDPLPITALLPLFRDNANTAAMIKHCLTVVQTAVHEVNPGQIPVVTMDQPLFALAKQIQWCFRGQYGEDKFVMLMGGLHIEMAALRMVGHWLDGSGWTHCLSQAGVATSGVAESFTYASHVKRTRYAHTVTAAALYVCLKRSYLDFCKQQNGNVMMSFDEWREERKTSSIQFRFWDIALELELLVLTFVRSIREGQFKLYIDCLQKLLPWFFACDQTNYARWLSVHVRDMLSLEQTHPTVYKQFKCGNFTVCKTRNKFSCISIDQVHEQLNAQIKGDGGAIGITENDAALQRWTIAGPEIMRLLKDFECDLGNDPSTGEHHERSVSFQRRFRDDVNKLLEVFEEETIFNSTNCDDLVALCSHFVAHPSVNDTVKSAESIGKLQWQTFNEDRLKGSVSIMLPLAKNKLPLFSFRPVMRSQKGQILKLREFKTDCELFSHLFIACQSRDGDLDEFFRHENHPYPPSLSHGGNLRMGTKSDLLECLMSLSAACVNHDVASLRVDCYVLDGAVIVQMLRPVGCKSFEDYKNKMFMPHIMSLLKQCNRVDVVFDVYKPDSLKSTTREHRGRGVRTKVTGKTKLPSNWQEFLRTDDNKTELFHYLAEADFDIAQLQNKTVIITCDEHVKICAGHCDYVATIDPCNHEEADTRIVLHCLHMSQLGSKSIAVRTVDTDVVVLAVAFFQKLEIEHLWIHFGVGKNMKLIAIHELTSQLSPAKCEALPMFHTLTGCDTVSCFNGKGKKSAWAVWNCYPEVTKAFINMKDVESEVNETDLHILERFVILMYDRTSECTDLDVARKHLFTKKSKMLEMLPPSSSAFVQHVKRAVHQAVHCWSQCLVGQVVEHDPSLCGWSRHDSKWVPIWMTLPEVAKSCTELIQCSCKKGCTARCKCVKANLPCTALCQCDGECDRT